MLFRPADFLYGVSLSTSACADDDEFEMEYPYLNSHEEATKTMRQAAENVSAALLTALEKMARGKE